MSKEPKRNVYVGHRYVPKVMGEWDKSETYEGLSIVTNEGTSYTSKKRVPKGIDILNEEYWVVTGNYNAQIEEYRKDVRELEKEVGKKSDQSYVDNLVDNLNEKVTTQLEQTNDIVDYNTNHGGAIGSRKLKPVMTIIDDDGSSQVIQKYLPSIKYKEYPITLAIVTDRINEREGTLTENQLIELSETGLVEMVSHTTDHRIDDNSYTTQEWEETVKKSKEWLRNRGYNHNAFVYPGGKQNQEMRKIVSNYYNVAFDIHHDSISDKTNKPPLDSYNLRRIYIEKGVNDVKTQIDTIVENGGWLVVGSHVHYESFNIKDIEEIVDYARLKNVDIKNVSDAISYYGNQFESGYKGNFKRENHMIIDAEGNVHGKQFPLRIVHFDYHNNEKITKFEPGVISIKWYSNNSANENDLPQKKAGQLLTDRSNTNANYNFQTYSLLYGDRVFRRNWNNDDNIFSDWYEISNIFALPKGIDLNGSIKPSDFPNNKISIVRVPYDTTVFPDNRGGKLTHDSSLGVNFIYQTYEVVKTARTYKRAWDTEKEEWTEWIMISNEDNV